MLSLHEELPSAMDPMFAGTGVPASCSMGVASPSYNVGIAITPNTISCTGAITGCSVSPALPAGLTLSTTTCVITGTPTTVTASATYTITPSNSAGNGATTLVSFAVIPGMFNIFNIFYKDLVINEIHMQLM